jgi:hypothetical protein
VRVCRIPEGLDFTQLLAALQVLVKRFEFQRNDPFRSVATRESGEYSGRLPRASRKRLSFVARQFTVC